MRIEEKTMLQMLSAFINNKAFVLSGELDWKKFYRLSEIHTVQAMLYYMLKTQNMLACVPPEAAQGWKQIYNSTLHWTVNQEYVLQQVLERLNAASVVHVLFKGGQLRHYYPVKELRTMGDIDILVREEDREQTGEVLESLGLRLTAGGGEVSNYRKGSVEIEVHTDVAAGMSFRSIECQAYFSDAIEHTVVGERPYTRYFDVNYHFVFLIFHLAKHFSYRGAGVKMFLDIAVYVKKFADEMDWDYIQAQLEQLEMLQFFKNVMYLCRRWFEMKRTPVKVSMDNELYSKLCAFILKGGTFGYAQLDESTFRLRRGVRKDGTGSKAAARLRAYRKYLFPGGHYLERYLPGVKARPYLLPLAWVVRAFQGIFSRRKLTVHNMMDYTKDMDKAIEQQKLLNEIGL